MTDTTIDPAKLAAEIEQPTVAPVARWTCPRGHSVPDGQACDICAGIDSAAGPGLAAAHGPSGYAGRDLLAVHELEAIVGAFATQTFRGTAAAEIPDPDDVLDLTCDGLLTWLGALAEHMQAERVSFAEVNLRLQVAARRQREDQAVAR